MQINKYVTALVLMLGLSAPAMAECGKLGTLEAFQEKAAQVEGIKTVTVTPSQLKSFVDKVGAPPPNIDTEKPYSAEMFILPNGLAIMTFHQDGCVAVHAGPAPVENFLKLMGLIDA